jgi:hypothetical protein
VYFEIFSPDGERIGIVGKYLSMQWTRRYALCGQFELHAPHDPALFVCGNIVVCNGEAAIIENIHITHSPTSGDIATIRGRHIISMLDRRIVWGTAIYTGTPENAIRQVVTDNATSGDRSLGITVAPSRGFPGSISRQSSYGNLLDEIAEIAEAEGYGLTLSWPGLVFDVYQSMDRTSGQSVNSRAIFSMQFENVLESEYQVDQAQYKNVALIAGQGEGEERLTETIGHATGQNRYEVYIDARDIGPGDDEESPLTEAEQKELLLARGREKMTEFIRAESFSATVNPYGNLRYKTDYDLGDVVTVIDWGLSLDLRITEIKEVYEGGKVLLEIILGHERVIRIG